MSPSSMAARSRPGSVFRRCTSVRSSRVPTTRTLRFSLPGTTWATTWLVSRLSARWVRSTVRTPSLCRSLSSMRTEIASMRTSSTRTDSRSWRTVCRRLSPRWRTRKWSSSASMSSPLSSPVNIVTVWGFLRGDSLFTNAGAIHPSNVRDWNPCQGYWVLHIINGEFAISRLI